MTTETKKTNTIVKVGQEVYRKFKSRAVLSDHNMSEALEEAMKLYCEEAKKKE